MDERGQTLASVRTSFVAPSVDDATQTVLVKAPVTARDGAFRADQFVKAQIVWSVEPAITVPVVAVSRVGGQYFAFVAEAADGGLVARQRPLTLGPVVGDAYIVMGGLSAGDRLVLAGIQKIGDGAPVQELPAGPPPGAGGRGDGRGGGA
jgi:multidrug efflux pump subunit AcrA (membrane-fusion protein)